ncbi:MerR family transcriptional regulator [Acidovorax sp. Leaf76]|uniref:MerR family transcriptional regulator n=1 Tax=unclassified Acidovorax TaxID=2684926 RepID=UPI0006F41143|nr:MULTISPECIES: MerR family transcriptional regulator [unclassified Acidovorax]KQO25313.1 MerR family transcriptional regulator [Acidovorax sp. Leaf76]KQO30349.1 MerR family transcriptional regulator [Acidovorax sp. Leaf84]KQS28582.1 MerR family transcriptional regulator [Acidovorax sp. Leaf191]
MLLKVGDLARRTGLTVRTLHHYDEIGLLKPSGRSDAGYRLYSQADVQRLHGIQTMRQMGLPLSDIGDLLVGDTMAPERIIGQQIRALDQQISQATELRGRLTMLRDGLMAGAEPDMGNWLEALALMTTYGKYFSSAELKQIFTKWSLIEADWLVVKDLVQSAMDRRLPPDAPEVQALAYRWMALMLHWMGGDMDLLERWGHMFRTEPTTHGRNHAPPGEMIEYVEVAIKLRMNLLDKYLTRDDLRALGHVPHTQWAALEDSVQQLLARGVAPQHADAAAAAQRWDALFGQLTRNDAALRHKLLTASMQEPLLQAGSPLSAPVRAYLHAAQAHAQAASAVAASQPQRKKAVKIA